MEATRIHLEETTEDNDFYRKVLFTGAHSQLVAMSLAPNQEIGSETHTVDQIIYIVEGFGTSFMDGREVDLEEGDAICIPAGVVHNVVNTGDEPMKLFTVYSPPQHPAGLVEEFKRAEATARA